MFSIIFRALHTAQQGLEVSWLADFKILCRFKYTLRFVQDSYHKSANVKKVHRSPKHQILNTQKFLIE